MEETQNQQQQTDSGAQHGQPIIGQRLPEVPAIKPGNEGVPDGFDASESELLYMLQSLIPLTGENLDQWTWEERRDFLNWCLDEGVLTIQDGRLVPVEELVPTAPLTHDTDANPPKRAKDAGFLRDVERAKRVIAANPAISAKELADALGLKSTLYSQTLKVSVDRDNAKGKGDD